MPKDIVERSDELDQQMDQLGSLNKTVEELVKAGKRSRVLYRLLSFSIILDIILTLFLVFVYDRTQNTHQTVVAGCEVGNQFRTNEVMLWHTILDLAATNNQSPTPQQIQQRAQFEQFLDKTFALRDCSKL